MSSRQPFLNARLQGFGATIFAEMSALAMKTDSVNLGQGFPDLLASRKIVEGGGPSSFAKKESKKKKRIKEKTTPAPRKKGGEEE